MQSPAYPSLYQINTRLWLAELARALGRPAGLNDVPEAALDHLAGLGFDWVWLLGIWQTGPAGRAVALVDPQLRREYAAGLPDFRDEEVLGSPFAVRRYSVHADFGDRRALARLRQRLRARGVRLLLDFVPNHTALDHAWVQSHPEFYVAGDEADRARAPANYWLRPGGNGPAVLARGRDPYFAAWPDTLQLNYRHLALRQAMIRKLIRIAGMCDGVRCDMAMLLLPEVFRRTWGDASRPSDGTPPVDAPFWPEAIARVRRKYPHFLFLAEVYWDLEAVLQQQGFDYTYDKRLYDRLREGKAGAVRDHLRADLGFQNRLARFLENHDEPRAAGSFPEAVHRAAAAVTFFVPGMRFFHEGQLEGRRIKACLQLGRRPEEPVAASLEEFYRRLLACLRRPEVRDGGWQLLACRPAWAGNPTAEHFLAFAWQGEAGRLLVTVNYGPTQGQCYVELPFADLRGRNFILRDLMGPARYERDGEDLASRGLYLDVPAWHYHVFEMAQAMPGDRLE